MMWEADLETAHVNQLTLSMLTKRWFKQTWMDNIETEETVSLEMKLGVKTRGYQ